MNVDRLRYFAAVVESGNLKRAAELVGIAPASMSKSIAALERELQIKLIHPLGRGIGITAAGLDIYRKASALINAEKKFLDELKHAAPRTEELRLATFEVFSTHFMSAFIESCAIPNMVLLELIPGAMEHAILSGSTDLGITYLPMPSPELEYREVGSFQMGIFGQEKWRTMDFTAWPFTAPTTELTTQFSELNSLDLWPKTAPTRNVRYRFEMLETALQTSRRGKSVLHCPNFVVDLQNHQVRDKFRLSSLPLPSGYGANKKLKIYLFGKNGAVPDSIERKLAKFIRSFN